MQKINLPATRYYGSKRKLIERIWGCFELLGIEFNSVLDVFGGSAMFSYYAKAKDKEVTYNDIFKFNYLIGKALIQNNSSKLEKEEVLQLLLPQQDTNYKNIIEHHFNGIYYPDIENKQIDIISQNISSMADEEKKASAYYIFFQSCLMKRPYNLFHRKNLNLRVNFNGGGFGNKITWERSFEELFLRFYTELKEFTFDNLNNNIALNYSALKCDIAADLVYIDPPYFKKKDPLTYHSKYHFLEGLANYDQIEFNIDYKKNNKEILINNTTEFGKKTEFLYDLETLIKKHRNSLIAISYRSDGIPSIPEISELLSFYRRNSKSINLGKYNYALNRNHKENCEYLLIG